jgi:hypothetical protein
VTYTTPDPDSLRVTVRYRRHYRIPGVPDPLPSATSVKPPKEFKTRTPLGGFVPVAALRTAEWALDHRGELGDMDPDMLIEEAAAAPERAMKQAADRGTHVHDALAAHILGQPHPVDLTPEEDGYYRAGLQFLADWSPTFVAVELVVWVPDLDVAGTCDWIAVIELDGAPVVVLGDWKTRGNGRHGAYPEEAAQLGIYSLATSGVTDTDTVVDLPPIEQLAVVSLTEDGSYGFWPIDVNAGQSAAAHMVACYRGVQLLEQTGKNAIGTPIIAAPTQISIDEALLDQRIAWLRDRLKALTAEARAEAARTWPDTAPRKAAAICSHTEIDDIAACLDRVEAAHRVPFGPPDPAQPAPAPGAGKPKVSPLGA